MHESSTILTDLTFILMHLFVFLFNYQITEKKIYQPAVLFSLIWVIILVLHVFFRFTVLDELYPLQIETQLIFFIGTLAFSFGAFLINIQKNLPKTKTSSEQANIIKVSLFLRLFFTGVILIGLPFYIRAAFKLFIASEAENFFHGLRNEVNYGNTDIGPVKYLLNFSFVTLALSIYAYTIEKNITNRILLIVCLIVTVTYVVFASGRTYFFMILCLYIGINFLQNKKFAFKKFAWLLALFIPLFMFYGMLSKTGDSEQPLRDSIKESTASVAIYLVTPLNAFDVEIKKNQAPLNDGGNTLVFFNRIAQQFGIVAASKPKSLIQEFVFVPYLTNVYTYYSPYRKDFGIIYAYIMLIIFGALHTWLCNKAIQLRTLRYTLYYSFLLSPLFLSFFSDQYMSAFSSWVQTFIFIEIALLLNTLLIENKVQLIINQD